MNNPSNAVPEGNPMTTITVKSQAEYDAAIADPSVKKVIIDSPKGVWLRILDTGSKVVVVSGSATIQYELIVYKAVDDALKSGRGFAYPIGETVTCPDWKEGDFCGNGLHFSPTPRQARNYHAAATRFLECGVPVDMVSVPPARAGRSPKLKAGSGRVLREVDINGAPVKVSS